MSTIHVLFRRAATNSSSLSLKSSSVIKYPTCSNYRSIWSSFVRKKEAPASERSAAAADTNETAETGEKTAQVDELLQALKEMKENSDELNDKYKRALAENENIRERFKKQVGEAKIFGIQGFVKDLLEVADVLNKATECVPKEEVTDKNPHLKNLYEGLTMTETILKRVFDRHGLKVVDPLNEKFNPNFHEALFEQQVAGKTAGTVVVVSKIGYKLHERIIRPALVGVAK